MNIPLMIPSINEDDIERAVSVLRSGNLIQGVEVELLEKTIASYIGVKHCVCVSNGTATLHLSLLALGIGPGDEVIVPAFSYIATANVVELVGAKPVFVDIDPDTFNININKIEEAITSRTKAIMPVQEFGLISDMEAVMFIARKHELKVIEDAACALGARQHDQFAGSIGDLGSFSFHPRKAITSGEGGIISTNNDELAAKLRILRNHGVQYIDGKMEFTAAGFNYRLTDFQAALINSQFNRFENIISIKHKLADVYFNNIKNPGVKLPVVPHGCNHTWQTFHIVWNGSATRDEVLAQLKAKGIGSNYGAQCMPAQIYYREKYNLDVNRLFPNALKAFEQGIALPLYDKMSAEQALYISQVINSIN